MGKEAAALAGDDFSLFWIILAFIGALLLAVYVLRKGGGIGRRGAHGFGRVFTSVATTLLSHGLLRALGWSSDPLVLIALPLAAGLGVWLVYTGSG